MRYRAKRNIIYLALPLMLICAVGFVISYALANDKDVKVELQMKGRSGEIYKTEYEMTQETVPFDVPNGVAMYSQSSWVRILVETQVEEVKPDGCLLLSERTTEFAKRLASGADKWEFDSTDLASRNAAQNNPELARFLKSLNVPIHYVQEPTGDLRNVSFDDDNVDPYTRSMLEDKVSQTVIFLPKQGVKILEEWDMGNRSRAISPMGRITIKYKGVLLDVCQEGEEQIAKIGIKGDAILEPDLEEDAKTELEDWKQGGVQQFSITRGRFISGYEKTESIVKVTLEGESFRIRSSGESHFKELK